MSGIIASPTGVLVYPHALTSTAAYAIRAWAKKHQTELLVDGADYTIPVQGEPAVTVTYRAAR